MGDNRGRCNNCWLVTEPTIDGACPRCGCFVFHVPYRLTKVYHGSMAACQIHRCPRRGTSWKEQERKAYEKSQSS